MSDRADVGTGGSGARSPATVDTVCGKCKSSVPTRRCEECQLLYCASCSEKRHRKGAFRRHAVSDLTKCEECEAAPATLHCGGCELNICNSCCADIHSNGTMAGHEAAGLFRALEAFPAPSQDAAVAVAVAAAAPSAPSAASPHDPPPNSASAPAPAPPASTPIGASRGVVIVSSQPARATQSGIPATVVVDSRPTVPLSKDDSGLPARAVTAQRTNWSIGQTLAHPNRSGPREADPKYRTWGGWELFRSEPVTAAPARQKPAVEWSQHLRLVSDGSPTGAPKYQTLQHLPSMNQAPPPGFGDTPATVASVLSPLLNPPAPVGAPTGPPTAAPQATRPSYPPHGAPGSLYTPFGHSPHHPPAVYVSAGGAGAGGAGAGAGNGVRSSGGSLLRTMMADHGASPHPHPHPHPHAHAHHHAPPPGSRHVSVVAEPPHAPPRSQPRQHQQDRSGSGRGRGGAPRQMPVEIDLVASGQDRRTTLMVRNIPNKYTQKMLLDEINETHRGKYDFFYLPIDFKNRCNVGYAFMNFIDFKDIISFYHTYNAKKWRLFNSEKICQLSYGRIQGKDSLVTRFQNSSLMDKEAGCRPLLFQSSGPRKGEPEEFPVRAARHSGRSHNRGHHHHRR